MHIRLLNNYEPCAGGRSVILLKLRRIFGHGEEAPSYDEETPQP